MLNDLGGRGILSGLREKGLSDDEIKREIKKAYEYKKNPLAADHEGYVRALDDGDVAEGFKYGWWESSAFTNTLVDEAMYGTIENPEWIKWKEAHGPSIDDKKTMPNTNIGGVNIIDNIPSQIIPAKISEGTKYAKQQAKNWERAFSDHEYRTGKSQSILSIIAQMIGGASADPTSLIGSGSGSIIKRVLLNAVGGAIGAGGTAAVMDRDNDEIMKSAAMGAVASAAFGEVLHGVGKLYEKYKTKSNNPPPAAKTETLSPAADNDKTMLDNVLKELGLKDEAAARLKEWDTNVFIANILKDAPLETKAQVLNDVREGKAASIIDQEKYNDIKEFDAYIKSMYEMSKRSDEFSLFGEELVKMQKQIETAKEQSINAYAKDVELQNTLRTNNPSLSQNTINDMVAVNNKPSAEMLKISELLNDGAGVNAQVAGTKILTRLEQSIANPVYSPEEFTAKLKSYGFGDEQISVFTKAYAQKDINIAKQYFNEKVAGKATNEVTARVKKTVDEKTRQKEKRGIWNVTFNGKNAVDIKMDDLFDVIRYGRGNRDSGAIHILQKHIGEGKYGELTPEELLNMGEIIRKGEMPEDLVRVSENGQKSYAYESTKEGIRYRVAVFENADSKKVMTMYSDKNVGKQDPVSQPPSNENIISQNKGEADEKYTGDETVYRRETESSAEAGAYNLDNRGGESIEGESILSRASSEADDAGTLQGLGQDTVPDGEIRGVSAGDEGVAKSESAGGDEFVVSGDKSNTVVRAEDADNKLAPEELTIADASLEEKLSLLEVKLEEAGKINEVIGKYNLYLNGKKGIKFTNEEKSIIEKWLQDNPDFEKLTQYNRAVKSNELREEMRNIYREKEALIGAEAKELFEKVKTDIKTTKEKLARVETENKGWRDELYGEQSVTNDINPRAIAEADPAKRRNIELEDEYTTLKNELLFTENGKITKSRREEIIEELKKEDGNFAKYYNYIKNEKEPVFEEGDYKPSYDIYKAIYDARKDYIDAAIKHKTTGKVDIKEAIPDGEKTLLQVENGQNGWFYKRYIPSDVSSEFTVYPSFVAIKGKKMTIGEFELGYAKGDVIDIKTGYIINNFGVKSYNDAIIKNKEWLYGKDANKRFNILKKNIDVALKDGNASPIYDNSAKIETARKKLQEFEDNYVQDGKVVNELDRRLC
jgi:hypothetical protein